jgi:aspartate racemase
MHIVAPAIEAAIDIPFIHIADPTAKALLGDGFRRVGLLGTRFTMEMPFYRERLEAAGLEVLLPHGNRPQLNAIIYEELCKGIVTEPSRQTYQEAIARLARHGAQAVILGCTEIGMLITAETSPLPVYDTTDLHAKALVSAALA